MVTRFSKTISDMNIVFSNCLPTNWHFCHSRWNIWMYWKSDHVCQCNNNSFSKDFETGTFKLTLWLHSFQWERQHSRAWISCIELSQSKDTIISGKWQIEFSFDQVFNISWLCFLSVVKHWWSIPTPIKINKKKERERK